jgi:predicted neutral ceramidase superfamily lipid hydrolase
MQQKTRDTLSAIFFGGVIAASIDIAAACLISGRGPAFIMQAIAGGLLGRASFQGGMATVILGAALQEVMGILIAAIYVVSSKTVPGLLRHWIPSGIAYGVIIFFVMNYVVVPLSALRSAPHFTPGKFAANLAAMLLFGLIVASFARRIGTSIVPAPAPRRVIDNL